MVGTFAEFQETMTLALPDVRLRVEDVFGESNKTSASHGLIVEVAAIHEGLTSNFNYYTADELEAALDSWVHPYPKPILINHNLEANPLGRVMAAKMDKEKDGSYFTRLQIAVTDPNAMARVSDKRYLTGSVGGKSKHALCSVCGTDWAEASPVSLPCKHTRGKTYKGKLAYLDRRELGFKEYSFVNAPADSLSGIRDTDDTSEESQEWVRPARVFDINMNKQEIIEFGESENRSVLQPLRRKEATPLYLQLKGAFLTALSAQEAELGIEEESFGVDEDILALSEELSDDLTMVAEGPGPNDDDDSDTDPEVIDTQSGDDDDDDPERESENSSDQPEVQEEEAQPEEDGHAHQDSQRDEDAAGQDDGGQEDLPGESAGEAEDGEVPVEEANFDPDDQRGLPRPEKKSGRAQGMEIPRLKHDPNTYGFSPMGGGGAGTQRRGLETTRIDKSRESEVEGEGTELNEATAALEQRVSDLEERENALLEENTRLKRALHRTLAERVVDTKIALGLHEATERETLLNEHMVRTAGSLADNLRDLAKMTFKRSTDPAALPTLEQKSLPGGKEHNVLEVVESEQESQELDPESVFVDALMGRRKL